MPLAEAVSLSSSYSSLLLLLSQSVNSYYKQSCIIGLFCLEWLEAGKVNITMWLPGKKEKEKKEENKERKLTMKTVQKPRSVWFYYMIRLSSSHNKLKEEKKKFLKKGSIHMDK